MAGSPSAPKLRQARISTLVRSAKFSRADPLLPRLKTRESSEPLKFTVVLPRCCDDNIVLRITTDREINAVAAVVDPNDIVAARHRRRSADPDHIVASATIDDGTIMGPHMVIAITADTVA
jgi:hypothetical protein